MFSVFRVRSLMTTAPEFLRSDEVLRVADDLMGMNRIRHLPVLASHSNELVGVVTQRDLFRSGLARKLGIDDDAAEAALDAVLVGSVMTPDPMWVTPDTTVTEAAERMIEYKIGCLPVLEDGRLVGILTESNFVELMASEELRAQLRRDAD